MKFLMLIFFAGYAVKCDESNYPTKQMPDEGLMTQIRKPFKVYWNVPTFQCKNTTFENLFDKYGIIQNNNDDFRGDKVVILYDPGSFPAYVNNRTRNGGVPQQGSLIEHLSSFRNILNKSIPERNFSGVGVIDFEAWRPVFRQHWGAQIRYKNESREIEKKIHGKEMNASAAEDLAKKNFEEAASYFMEYTLLLAKKMRPNAQWGYYGFPYCFNGLDNDVEHCSKEVKTENDGLSWLWSESTALYPSVYSSKKLTSSQLEQFVRGRVSEAARVRQNETPILPYFSFSYREGSFFHEVDLETAVKTLYKSEASGFIIWGSSNDVNTAEKCTELLNYVDKVMGPAIATYTKNDTKEDAGEKDAPIDNSPPNTCNCLCTPYNNMYVITIVSLVINLVILICMICIFTINKKLIS